MKRKNTPTDKVELLDVSDRHNLPSIKFVSAVHSGNIDKVLETLRRCEGINLDDNVVRMACDIAESIGTERNGRPGATAYYLVRYGMILEQEKKSAAPGATNTQDGKMERFDNPVSASIVPQNEGGCKYEI